MRNAASNRLVRLLEFAPVALFCTVLLLFGAQSEKFLARDNFTQILIQASSTAVVAVGMTFVLLTAGVDLSVGAVMFVGAALAGKLALAGYPLLLCLLVMLAIGLLAGALNAFLVTRLKLIAFIATLAMLYIGRGLGRWITQTRAMNLPDSFLALGSSKWLGVPLPLWIAGVVVLLAQVILSKTPFGRQLYALGNNLESARKAGLRTGPLLASVYVICGLCAARRWAGFSRSRNSARSRPNSANCTNSTRSRPRFSAAPAYSAAAAVSSPAPSLAPSCSKPFSVAWSSSRLIRIFIPSSPVASSLSPYCSTASAVN
jgi:ribose/xylose/arabinose/galactoside ABC-type transport system permease subunit